MTHMLIFKATYTLMDFNDVTQQQSYLHTPLWVQVSLSSLLNSILNEIFFFILSVLAYIFIYMFSYFYDTLLVYRMTGQRTSSC